MRDRGGEVFSESVRMSGGGSGGRVGSAPRQGESGVRPGQEGAPTQMASGRAGEASC